MANPGKSSQLWIVNQISFVLFCISGLTGLINWLLPRGLGSGGGFLISLRHFLRDVHAWSGLVFILVVVIHLFLHEGYIKSNLKRSGLIK